MAEPHRGDFANSKRGIEFFSRSCLLVEMASLQVQKMENEQYLRAHPELGALLGAFSSELFASLPADPVAFAANWWTTRDLHSVALAARSPAAAADAAARA